MKKVLIIEKIHKSAIKLLKNRKDFSFEVVENLEINHLKNNMIQLAILISSIIIMSISFLIERYCVFKSKNGTFIMKFYFF